MSVARKSDGTFIVFAWKGLFMGLAATEYETRESTGRYYTQMNTPIFVFARSGRPPVPWQSAHVLIPSIQHSFQVRPIVGQVP